MSNKTAIRWTNTTWNPVIGCSKVSPGCAHCYAEQLSKSPKMANFGYTGLDWTPANAHLNVQLRPDRLELPLRWSKPRMVFVNSMSDLFHDLVPDEFIEAVFAVMSLAGSHIFQVLTKRPERMREWVRKTSLDRCLAELTASKDFDQQAISTAFRRNGDLANVSAWPLPNVWLGTSVENQHWADKRIPLLLDTPAAVRFLSCEPLLGPVSLRDYLFERGFPVPWRAFEGEERALHWVIAGGESGPKFRAMNVDWARLLRDECSTADVPFFFKQSGGLRSETGQLLDGVRWEQMPKGVRG